MQLTGKDDTKQQLPSGGLREEPREFVQDAKARFAPADNLYDAIRADIAHLGEFEFHPLGRQGVMRIPFFDPDADD